MARPIVIHADWDPEAAVWVATTNDLKGLVTEAELHGSVAGEIARHDPRSS